MVATLTPFSPSDRKQDSGFATSRRSCECDIPLGFAGGDENLFRYVHNQPTNLTDPSGHVEVPSAADDRFTYRIDRGEQIYGGFEIHVYKNGEEVAKINGHGGWADKHGGKKLPYKPSEFRDAFEEVQKKNLEDILRTRCGGLGAQVGEGQRAGMPPAMSQVPCCFSLSGTRRVTA